MAKTPPSCKVSLRKLFIKKKSIIKNMMQSELFLPSWQTFNFASSTLDHNMPCDHEEMDFCRVDELDFSCSFTSFEDSPMISSNSIVPNTFSDEFLNLENSVYNEHQVSSIMAGLETNEIQVSSGIEGLEIISSGEIEEIFEWINENETEENSSCPLTMETADWSPSLSLQSNENPSQFPQTNMSLIFPGDEIKVDDQLRLLHLLMAYAESMGNGELELSAVIVKSIHEISSPLGKTMERVAYNLFQSREDQGEYLRQQSLINFVKAFKVVYQGLPNGKFAHFTANSNILESVPIGVDTIHIIDFDMGEGIQWPPVIEALSMKQKTLRLTSIKSEDECVSSYWEFEETKKRLEIHARQFGVKLIVEERGVEELVNELMKMKKREQGREWFVFNCMVGLPHMGRRSSRNRVTKFLKIAKEFLANFAGIAILGDGELGEDLDVCSSYSSFFDKLLRHYQAIFESLERSFPTYLADARIALESLFLAPLMCPVALSQEWEETRNGCCVRAEMGLKGRKLSQESLAEAKQVVNERENCYEVRIEGLNEHEMVLRWKGTPLVRVSAWM